MPSARASVVLASLAFILTAAPCAAEWRRLDSPNFTVVGDVGARELRDLALKFEGFRETLGRAISERAATSAVPTIIIVFPTDKAFTPFKPMYQGKPRAVAGFFAAGANINYILMQSGVGGDRIVFHEYAHLIVSNVMSNPPIWLNEGLAEFYSTFRLMDGGRRAQLGLAIGEHLQLLRNVDRVPLPELLKVDAQSPLYNEAARASVFYAESWALTHMILNGQPSRVGELAAYLRSVGDGVPEARAWEETFGTARTEQEFRQYLARDLYNTVVIDFPEKVAALSATPRVLSPADVAAFLGAFLVQHRQYDEAAAQLEQAFKSDPVNALATVAMAQLEIGRQQYAGAEKRLVGLGKSGDWLVAYSAAMATADLAGIGIAGSPDVGLIQAAQHQLDVVQRDRGELPNALAHRAALDLTTVDVPGAEASASIARARVLTPGRYDYAFIQAQILTRRGEFADARAVLGPLMTGMYPPGVRDSARSLMGFVVESESRGRAGGRARATSLPATLGSRSVPVPGFEPQPRRQDDGRPKFVPDFRQVQAGEQRFEATLERIDCAPGRPAVFRVTNPSERLEAARLGDVDFISYRDDLRGGVKCGVLAVAMRVFITWREGNSATRQKTVVAVEFLPKN
jgi:hypothetical protein